MKCRLYVRLTAPRTDPLGEYYTELQLTLDIPFLPHAGMSIGVTPIDILRHSNESGDTLRQYDYIFRPFFTVAKVSYHHSQTSLVESAISIYCYERCESSKELEEVREQAIREYGFIRDESETFDEEDDEVDVEASLRNE